MISDDLSETLTMADFLKDLVSKPVYRVQALEQWTVVSVYAVSADSREEAEAQCRSVEGFREDHTIQGSTWIETIQVEEV